MTEEPRRIVVLSDVHADRETIGVSRLREAETAFDMAVSYAIDERADAFVFAGDLCDPDNGGATMFAIELAVRAARWLTDAGVMSVWVAGNHDVEEDGSGATTLTPLGGLGPLVQLVEEPRMLAVAPDLMLLCFPYVAVSRAYDPDAFARRELSQAATIGARRVVSVSHLMLSAATPGEETTEMPRGRDMPFPLEATRTCAARIQGHYHRRAVLDAGDDGPPIHVVGAPLRLTFGEADHEPAFLDVVVR